MLVLSPDQPATATAVDWEAPVHVRNLGKIPDVTCLEPGDLVLCEPVGADRVASAIQAVQRRSFSPIHARWTHVAIIFDKERWIEALTRAVSCGSVFDRCHNHHLRFRRATGLPLDVRTAVALQAMTYLRARYTLGQAGFLGLKAFLPNVVRSQFRPHQKAIICSQLFADAFAEKTGGPAAPPHIADIMPAHLSRSEVFEDIPVSWRPLI